jgi:hypothetical protein
MNTQQSNPFMNLAHFVSGNVAFGFGVAVTYCLITQAAKAVVNR